MTPDVPRTALVTGAGRGIGRGVTLGLAAAGYAVGLVGRTRSHLDVVAEEVRALGVPVAVAAADLVDVTAVADAVARVETELGGIGLLVNNAGVVERAEVPFGDDDVEDMWRVVETNVRGPMLVTHAVLPGMLARSGGRVLNINSGAGYQRGSAYTAYGMSKGALARLTTLLDAQYRDRGIRVLDLAPGVVATDMTSGMPLHAERTEWTPVEQVAELVRAFGDGELDDLSGRFVRAGADTVATLRAAAGRIVEQDARRLRVGSFGPGDPLFPPVAASLARRPSPGDDRSMDLTPIRFEYHLHCEPGPAFDVYVQQIGRWWHPDYSPDPAGFVGATIEPWVGGRVLLEDATRGVLPWGEVLEVTDAARLVHSSTLGQTREDPSRITVTFEVQAEGGTLMTFEHGGWTEENATDRVKFTEWSLILDRFAALADGA